jgi:hypothetical protein
MGRVLAAPVGSLMREDSATIFHDFLAAVLLAGEYKPLIYAHAVKSRLFTGRSILLLLLTVLAQNHFFLGRR